MTLQAASAGEQLERELRQFCRQSDPNQAILPERKLAEQYEISHGTVRRVLATLLEEGVIYKVQGRGTFVAERQPAKEPPTIIMADTWEDVTHPHSTGRLRGAVQAADALGVRLEVLQCDRQLLERERLLTELARDQVRGLIIPWTSGGLLERIRQANPSVEIVVTASNHPPDGAVAVGVDFASVGVMGIRGLRKQGAQNPICVLGHFGTLCGVEEVCGWHSMKPSIIRVAHGELVEAEVAQEIKARSGDALLFDDDAIAARVLPLLAPLTIPVASQDNVGNHSLPKDVIRVAVDGQDIGRLIISELAKRLAGGPRINARILVRPTLVMPDENI